MCVTIPKLFYLCCVSPKSLSWHPSYARTLSLALLALTEKAQNDPKLKCTAKAKAGTERPMNAPSDLSSLKLWVTLFAAANSKFGTPDFATCSPSGRSHAGVLQPVIQGDSDTHRVCKDQCWPAPRAEGTLLLGRVRRALAYSVEELGSADPLDTVPEEDEVHEGAFTWDNSGTTSSENTQGGCSGGAGRGV